MSQSSKISSQLAVKIWKLVWILRFGMKLGVLSLIVDTKLPLKDRAYTKLYNYDQFVNSDKRLQFLT